jgi:hypothetical protein
MTMPTWIGKRYSMPNLGEIVLLDFSYTNCAGSKVRLGNVIAVNGPRNTGGIQ